MMLPQIAIVPLIESVPTLRDAAAAHRQMEAGQHFGKIVLDVVGSWPSIVRRTVQSRYSFATLSE